MDANDPRKVTLPAERISRGALVALASVCALELVFVIQLHRHLALGLVWLGAAGALIRASRLPHARRVKIARLAVPALALAWLAESRAARSAPRDGTVAARRGVAFDTRTPLDVVRDERAGGGDATTAVTPASVMAAGGVEIEGRRVIPLGGIAHKKTVLCNEGGEYTTYTSDDYGFHNPRGVWGELGPVEVGIVGEAFMHGACVPSGAGAADVIRARYPRTVNLGMVGNGPLTELGGIVEYLSYVKPKIVLWAYYHNDFATLEAEKASPILRAYVDADGRQGLYGKGREIDAALAGFAAKQEGAAQAWPRPLATIGLTRRSTPMFLQDWVMGEDHSSLGAALRFDKLSGAIGARLARKTADAPPDFATWKRVLEKAKRVVASWGGTLHFVYLADLHHLSGPEHPLRKQVLDLVRELDLPLIDVQPAFAKERDPMTLRYHAESHCNEAGNRLIGSTVLSALR